MFYAARKTASDHRVKRTRGLGKPVEAREAMPTTPNKHRLNERRVPKIAF
jgi:hypothetical protein